MTEAKILEGWFWLPGDSRRVYGRLEHDLSDGPRLHLVGAEFVDVIDEGQRPVEHIAAIHGETTSGRQLTVLDFRTTHWSLPTHDLERKVVDGVAERVVLGEHVADADEITANFFVCSLHRLREFAVGTTAHRGPVELPVAGEERSQPLITDLGNGARLMITAYRKLDGQVADYRSRVHVSAQFEVFPARSITEIERECVQPLQDLILFATRRQSYVTAFSAIESPAGRSVELLAPANPRPHDDPELWMLALNLAVEDDPGRVIRAWYDLRTRVGPVWESFFKVLGRGLLPPEEEFIPVVSFAEGYHRAIHGDCAPLGEEEHAAAVAAMRTALEHDQWSVYAGALKHANTRTQRRRLADLIERAVEVIDWWPLDAKRFRDEVVDTRNWLIHWGEKGRHTVEQADERALLTQRVVIVLYVNMALELGLEPDVVAGMINAGWDELR